MIIITPVLDAGVSISTEINIWSIILPVILTATTAGIIALGTKWLDRDKSTAEQKKILAEEKKLKVEADSLENEEWRKLYVETKSQAAEMKSQYADLKKQSDEQIEKLKKESSEQMGFLKKQISIHSDTLEVQGANFEAQEETIQELKDKLETEIIARQKLELIIKKFKDWAIRNKQKIYDAHLEPIPIEIYDY